MAEPLKPGFLQCYSDSKALVRYRTFVYKSQASTSWLEKKRYGDSLFGPLLLSLKLKLCYQFLWR